jgi:hypothetical protein
MKIAIFFLLLSISCKSQTIINSSFCAYNSGKYDWKNTLVPASFAGIAGIFGGLHEVIQNHYPSFKRVFPKANDQYWNPAISFHNKEWRGAVPVTFTDGYHLTRDFHNITLYCSGITLGIDAVKCHDNKRYWWHLLIDAGITTGAYYLTSQLTWRVIFHK